MRRSKLCGSRHQSTTADDRTHDVATSTMDDVRKYSQIRQPPFLGHTGYETPAVVCISPSVPLWSPKSSPCNAHNPFTPKLLALLFLK